MQEKCFNRECRDADNSDSGCRILYVSMEKSCGDYLTDPLLSITQDHLDGVTEQRDALVKERDTLRTDNAKFIKDNTELASLNYDINEKLVIAEKWVSSIKEANTQTIENEVWISLDDLCRIYYGDQAQGEQPHEVNKGR